MAVDGSTCVMRICGHQLYVFIPRMFEAVIAPVRAALTALTTQREGSKYKKVPMECYSLSNREEGFEILTYTGLSGIVKSVLDLHNIPYKACEVVVGKDKSEKVYRLDNLILLKPLALPRLSEVIGSFREWQLDALPLICNSRMGVISVATGGGKSYFVSRMCYAASDCKILVHTAEVPDLQVLYHDIMGLGLDVTWVKGPIRSSQTCCRIFCCTTQSVHHCSGMQFDICFGDEVQKLASKVYRSSMWNVYSRRTFGFSATVGNRADKQDMMVMGQFGPILLERTYQQNQNAGDIVPIYVRRITTTIDPKTKQKVNSRDPAIRYRHLIVRNHNRNQEFANVVKHYLEQGHQVLVVTSTVEHALRMAALLPEDTVACYRSVDDRVKKMLMKERIWRPTFKDSYSNKDMMQAIDDFASGRTRVAVSNRVWWKAKNFPRLFVLARLDAINTYEAAVQIAGRLSRRCPEIGKTHGLLIDGLDEFDNSTKRNSANRSKIYTKLGWKSWEELTVMKGGESETQLSLF